MKHEEKDTIFKRCLKKKGVPVDGTDLRRDVLATNVRDDRSDVDDLARSLVSDQLLRELLTRHQQRFEL